MQKYKQDFSIVSADSGALFFKRGLFLKDGRPTPGFYNAGAYAAKASLRLELARGYAGMIKKKMDEGMSIGIIFGPSYKASMIAGDATMVLFQEHGIDLGCNYDRKEAKAHGEASKGKSMFVGAKFYDGCNVYMVDDVGTSMATKIEGLEKIAAEAEAQGININVTGIGIAVDREQVGPVYDESKPADLPNKEKVILDARGEDAIGKFVEETGKPVDAIVGIGEMMAFLFESQHPLLIDDERQPMSQERYDEFLAYMEQYGVSRG